MEEEHLIPEQPLPQEKKFYLRRKLQLFAFIGIVAMGLFLVVYFQKKGQQPLPSNLTQQPEATVATPTPVPFVELTVPYLRAKNYESSLASLARATETSTYNGYLTSYTSDGFKVNGFLTVPKGEEPLTGWPAIIFIHGYIPPASYRTLENYSAYVDSLARNGFVVFKIDLRGHGISEGEPGGGYYGSDYITDALSARNALQKEEFINSDKIGFWGHSMAGNVVLRSLTAAPEIPAAVVWAGAVFTYEDWQKYGIDDGSYRPPENDTERQRRRRELFDTHGEFDPQSPFWSQVSPTNYLSDLTGAIQLNHAIDDPVVNIGYSRDLAVLLDEAGVEFDLQEYGSGGHNLSGSAFNLAMQNTIEFFERYLKN